MSSETKTVFADYFRTLEERGIPAVILHSYHGYPETIPSDIDYAVATPDLAKLPGILHEVALRNGWVVAQEFQHQVTACYSIIIDPEMPTRFLKLDACSHYVKDLCFLIPAETLLKDRIPFKGFYIPAPAAEFIYTVAKIFGKNKDPEPYLSSLKGLYDRDVHGAESRFSALFGDTGRTARDWLGTPPAEWRQLDRIMRHRNRYGPLLLWKEFLRRLSRAIHPTGLHLTLLGPDGVGKSTLIARLKVLLEPCFRKQLLLHFRPMLLERAPRGVVSDPHAKQPRSMVSSLLKVCYYFADNLLGYWALVYPAKACSTLIVFDRSFEDMLVDQRRYRLQGTGWLVKLLGSFLPRPDLTLILDAPPEVVHRRKPELPVAEILRQRGVLMTLGQGSPKNILIPAEGDADAVASRVAGVVISALASRRRRFLAEG